MLSRSSCISEPVVDVTCRAVAANDSDAEAEVSRVGQKPVEPVDITTTYCSDCQEHMLEVHCSVEKGIFMLVASLPGGE